MSAADAPPPRVDGGAKRKGERGREGEMEGEMEGGASDRCAQRPPGVSYRHGTGR